LVAAQVDKLEAHKPVLPADQEAARPQMVVQATLAVLALLDKDSLVAAMEDLPQARMESVVVVAAGVLA
jgi:hypothetical protein